MKTIVLYSTRTGNTNKIAEAIASAVPGAPCVNVKDVPADLASYDLVFVGFWVDKGDADAEAKKVMQTLDNQYVGVFATLGAKPDSDHAKECLKKASSVVPGEVVGKFICQGALDPTLIEAMYKMFPAGHPHGRTPEREALHAEAAKHPDAQDCANAKAFAEDVLQKIAAKA